MVDLIRALIQVKTPLTLFAFVSLVFLIAFRTQRVPELFFGLAKEKLTRERFAQLLHRFMLFGLIGFVLVVGLAFAGQILALKTQTQPLKLDELRDELKETNASEIQVKSAMEAYTDGLARLSVHDLTAAIQSLQKSFDAVPTLSAQTTLAYLYRKQRDTENAKKYGVSALALATQRGDSVAQVRLRAFITSLSNQSEQGGMVGDEKPFPQGGKSFKDAVPVSPGLYVTTSGLSPSEKRYYKIRLKADQTLRIDCRTSDAREYATAGASIYDADGVMKPQPAVTTGRSRLVTVQWTTPVEGVLFFSIGSDNPFGNDANSVYRISIL